MRRAFAQCAVDEQGGSAHVVAEVTRLDDAPQLVGSDLDDDASSCVVDMMRARAESLRSTATRLSERSALRREARVILGMIHPLAY